ncbi:hypothetical protein BG006_007821 [Podila minutissima]|uniref:FAM192A/Fyv6 N-terminal domain-containing protein n=1 Tax=Podila minutissima TaxID=64525 RepID=A0A9P5VK14_9FUNG|nr:hypothetical protein BG006_007821 [Podila minutissima]
MFNLAFFFSSEIQEEYKCRNDGQENLVRVNDVFFAVHALILSSFTLVQTYIYKRDESQSVSIPSKLFILGAIGGTVSIAGLACYIKLAISFIKYCPQVYINYKARSTVGWSIGNILLDFTGGVLSTAQLVLDAYISGDWSGISGDPVKFGLGFISIVFDIIFITQHYVLYRNRDDFYAPLSMVENELAANIITVLLCTHYLPSIAWRTETLDEARKERQDEWDKAYKNSENPPPIQEEVPYDPRTLYERLQEQKQKKDDAFAEATKFDNDEFDFLSTLENEEAQKKRDLADQEAKDLEAFRQNQLKTQPLPEPTAIGSALAVPSFTSSLAGSSAGAKKNKKSLFGGLVKRKDSEPSTADDSISFTAGSKGTEKDESGSHSSGKRKEVGDGSNDKEHENKKTKVATTSASKPTPSATATTTPAKPVAQKAGLLGLVAYDSSSDEDDE